MAWLTAPRMVPDLVLADRDGSPLVAQSSVEHRVEGTEQVGTQQCSPKLLNSLKRNRELCPSEVETTRADFGAQV